MIFCQSVIFLYDTLSKCDFFMILCQSIAKCQKNILPERPTQKNDTLPYLQTPVFPVKMSLQCQSITKPGKKHCQSSLWSIIVIANLFRSPLPSKHKPLFSTDTDPPPSSDCRKPEHAPYIRLHNAFARGIPYKLQGRHFGGD